MYTLFWKKKKTNQERRLIKKEVIDQIKAISPGERASYRLIEANGNNLATVELNTGYTGSGKKYMMSTRPVANAMRTGKEEQVIITDDASEIANWLIEHRAKRRLHRRTVLPNNIRYRTVIHS